MGRVTVRHRLLASLFALSTVFGVCARAAHAQQAPDAPAVVPGRPNVRVALSREADLRLFSLRVRRLLAIELYGIAEVDERPAGTLDAELIRVWIDVPVEGRGLIEVRRDRRPLARRALNLKNLPNDVAARIVAIEAAEMVRVQARTRPQRPAPKPNLPQPDDDAASDYAVEAAGVAQWLPLDDSAWAAGGELAIEHRHSAVGQRLYGRWLLGETGSLGPIRWLELGAGADLRVSIAQPYAARFGVTAGFAVATLPYASTLADQPGQSDWTATANLFAGIEARADNAVFGAGISAGTLLKPLAITTRANISGELSALQLGLRLSIAAAPVNKPRRSNRTSGQPKSDKHQAQR